MPLYPPINLNNYEWLPADRGLIAHNNSIEDFGGTVTPGTAGRIEGAKIKLPSAAVVTNIVMSCQTAGSTLTAGQCFAALYTPAGALVAQTADQAGSWASSGIKTMALAAGPFTLAAGNYNVCFWYNGTTSPTWLRGGSIGSPALNLGTAAPAFMWFTADTGLTTTAPGTLGTETASASAYWVALS